MPDGPGVVPQQAGGATAPVPAMRRYGPALRPQVPTVREEVPPLLQIEREQMSSDAHLAYMAGLLVDWFASSTARWLELGSGQTP